MALYYSIILLLLFYFLLILEFFLPTGGMLGAAAVAAFIATIVVAFSHSITAGVTMLVIAVATTPIVFLGMVKVWPHTPIGRRMLNRRPGELFDATPVRTTSQGTPLGELVGRIGLAKTNLLPSGTVTIDSQKLDAISTGMPIDAGTRVVVINTDAGKIHVRAAEEDEHDRRSDPPKSPPSLEKPLESFEFE
jgi:membrane-bound ClpP family serine protease